MTPMTRTITPREVGHRRRRLRVPARRRHDRLLAAARREPVRGALPDRQHDLHGGPRGRSRKTRRRRCSRSRSSSGVWQSSSTSSRCSSSWRSAARWETRSCDDGRRGGWTSWRTTTSSAATAASAGASGESSAPAGSTTSSSTSATKRSRRLAISANLVIESSGTDPASLTQAGLVHRARARRVERLGRRQPLRDAVGEGGTAGHAHRRPGGQRGRSREAPPRGC